MIEMNELSPYSIDEIKSFLYREAGHLDSANLDDWCALYTEDATYWMPITHDQEDPHNQVSLLYENNLLMDIRRRNFGHRLSPAMEAKVHCSHLIDNIKVTEFEKSTGSCVVTSNFQAVVYYQEQTVFAGTYEHHLLRIENDYRIRHKRVNLINCDAYHKAIIIYV
ncbi:aromatic-ring-hydroxylating dioxygenase subunit beta [Kineobactrum salinum]|uniref:Aromatic-ring-hydroxylating dioxygenase subunit beta n=1 Tax=Kineobactrum salinum TaxID=2708301 RepID=A0A6C0TYS9_9GAMM|nr:aromatic-ring-hydroxylating dioxygenase subunit beta [Kineobactrum salinum]QIB64926.1 aromatic-ring-hydroxylating dioxygenase subunit beta [Kineobactrum salinum]